MKLTCHSIWRQHLYINLQSILITYKVVPWTGPEAHTATTNQPEERKEKR